MSTPTCVFQRKNRLRPIVFPMPYFVNAYSTIRDNVPWTGRDGGPTYSRSLVEDSSTGPFLLPQPPGSEARDLEEHLNGFANYARQQGVERAGEYNSSIHSVFHHILRVRRHYVFECDNNVHWSQFSQWGKVANAVFFMPDGTVRDNEGRDLLDPANAQGEHPIMAPTTVQAQTRRDRIRGRLWEEGVRISPILPPVLSEPEVVLRRSEEVLNRAKALVVVAAVAMSVAEGEAVDVASMRSSEEFFTQEETSFLDAVDRFSSFHSTDYPAELHEQAVQLRWGFVTADLLAWVVGVTDSDPFELVAPDPSALRATLDAVSSPQELSPHSLEDICNAWEYTFSMRWFAVDQALKANKSDYAELGKMVQPHSFHLEPVQGSILLERHRALSWLLNPNVPYEDTDLST